MFKNLKIRYKLLSLFFLITLSTVGVIIFFLSQMAVLRIPLEEHMPEQIESIKTTSRLDSLAQLIKYYDEVLTQSARSYAFTGDNKWKNRYKDAEPKLDIVIKDAIKEGGRETKVFFDKIDSANLALVKLEYQSIEAVDNKDQEGAIRVLESAEYWRLKEEYKQGLEKYLNSRGVAYEQGLKEATDDLTFHNREARNIINFSYTVVIVFSILLILLTITAGMVIVRQILMPLAKLNKGVEEIGKGNLSHVIDINSDDEIGILSKAFNKMTSKIRESHVEIESKVKERTLELDRKVKDLEKFQRLTIDRELKMVELKKEVEELKTKAEDKKNG